MWQLLGTLVMNPSYLIIAALIALSTWLYVQDTYHKSQVADLKVAMAQVEKNYQTAKDNELKLIGAVEKCNGQTAEFESNIKMLIVKVEEEKKRVEYWRKMFNDKKCFNNGDEEPVRPESGKVLNDEKSVEAVRTINTLLGVK